jgi:hypothetical protein
MRSLLSEPPFCKRTALLAAAYLFWLRKIYQAYIPMNFFLLIYNCILGETLFACIPDDDLVSQINLDDFLHSMLYHSINELGQNVGETSALSSKMPRPTNIELVPVTNYYLSTKKIEYLCAKDNPVP